MNASSGLVARSPWWVPWFAFAIVAALWAWNASVNENDTEQRQILRDAQVESCERVNALRREVNHRGLVLQEFLMTAAEARQHAALTAPNNSPEQRRDTKAAQLWRSLAQDIAIVEIPDCAQVIPEVASFTPSI